MILQQLLVFVLTYWVASDLCCLGVLKVSRADEPQSLRDVFFVTRGLGPIVISWLLYHLFLLAPKHSPSLYTLAVLVVLTGMLVVGRSQIPRLIETYRGLFRDARQGWPLPALATTLLVFVVGISLFVLVVGIGFPIVESDALAFTTEARLIYRDRGFEHYPTVAADPETGYYYDTFQVPCLQMLYVWFSLLTGGSHLDILARTVAPMYAIYCVLLVSWLLARRTHEVETALWGGLALIATPVFASGSYFNTQDPHRIYLSLAALVLLDACLTSRRLRDMLLLGVFLGLAIYAHFFGLLTLLAALLLYLWLAEGGARAKIAAVCLISVAAVLVGALHHYTRPVVAGRVLQQFPVFEAPFDALRTRLGLGHLSPEPSSNSAQVFDWMAARRGQDSQLKQFLFGKLQLLTGIEWFGASFWLFLGAVMLWLRRREQMRLEKILFGTAVLYALVVLSDVRVMALSNPRYIATALPVCAYFTALLVTAVLPTVKQQAGRLAYRLTAGAAIVVLVIPLVASTAVRGAKVGITNPGGVYERLRGGEWIGTVVSHPFHAVNVVWERYLGIKDTMKYSWASDETKLRHAHDSFAAIAYMNAATPAQATALVFRTTRYFYYASRKGVSYVDLRLEAFATIRGSEAACNFLKALGVDYVVFDTYFDTYPLYRDTALASILADPALSKRIYEYGSAAVYKLLCNPRN